MGRQIKIKATLKQNVNKAFRLQSKLFSILHRNSSTKNIPVIINNFNRLQYLQQQVAWLLQCGHKNIHIIDNASTYMPLLDYYKKAPATIYRLDRNLGHEAFWRTHLFQRFGKSYHVYTDPDVLPAADTPADFMEYFMSILKRYPQTDKVGFGLKTDDLPDHYPKKKQVIDWETALLKNEIAPGIFKARIDTTFALYRPGKAFQCWDATLRTGAPYLLKHMPWYEDPENLSAETIHYLQTASASSSWYQAVKNGNTQYPG